MSTATEEPIVCADDDGDASLSSIQLQLWEICLSTQKTFDAEVIFEYSSVCYPIHGDEFISFFVPRDHPRIEEMEAHLMQRLEPVRRHLVKTAREVDGWQPSVYISLYRYSGVAGAMAFGEAAHDVMDAGVDLEHPDPRRLMKMATEAGRKAARLAARRN
jgi:hypothetical protein